jgi:glycosyltransferase involved in cell wall biosynthesis
VSTPRTAADRPRAVLVIAYHFPPLVGSSGILRTLNFVRHLPRFGWTPIVLTCQPRAYEQLGDAGEVPAHVHVERAFALDTARHLAIRGRYPARLALPDRWISWWPDAVRRGRRLVREHDVAAIFSTYPIASAHVIGHSLAQRSRLPWIADFRDPMAQQDYPPEPARRARFEQIEQDVFALARACTFTTESAARTYRARYADSRARIEVIENGYDEDAFAAAELDVAHAPLHQGALTLVHSGIVYPDERDPRHLFAALARLKAAGVGPERVRARFRAPVHETMLGDLARRHGVEDMVEVLPAIPYREALAEMLRADGLLVLQAANCNEQVPAKLYEYIRARRPIVALTDAAGDTAAVLRRAGVIDIAPLDDEHAICALLGRFARGQRDGLQPRETAVQAASRLARTEALARLLDALAAAGVADGAPARAVRATPC